MKKTSLSEEIRRHETLSGTVQRLHGEYGECPTCGASGRFDMKDSTETAFEESIWLNKQSGGWECYECWLK